MKFTVKFPIPWLDAFPSQETGVGLEGVFYTPYPGRLTQLT